MIASVDSHYDRLSGSVLQSPKRIRAASILEDLRIFWTQNDGGANQ